MAQAAICQLHYSLLPLAHGKCSTKCFGYVLKEHVVYTHTVCFPPTVMESITNTKLRVECGAVSTWPMQSAALATAIARY